MDINGIKRYAYELSHQNKNKSPSANKIFRELNQQDRKILKNILKEKSLLSADVERLGKRLEELKNHKAADLKKTHRPIIHALKNLFGSRISTQSLISSARKLPDPSLSQEKSINSLLLSTQKDKIKSEGKSKQSQDFSEEKSLESSSSKTPIKREEKSKKTSEDTSSSEETSSSEHSELPKNEGDVGLLAENDQVQKHQISSKGKGFLPLPHHDRYGGFLSLPQDALNIIFKKMSPLQLLPFVGAIIDSEFVQNLLIKICKDENTGITIELLNIMEMFFDSNAISAHLSDKIKDLYCKEMPRELLEKILPYPITLDLHAQNLPLELFKECKNVKEMICSGVINLFTHVQLELTEEHFIEFAKLPHLTKLSFFNNFSIIGHVHHLSKIPHLKHLNLSRCLIVDVEIKALPTSLESLHLSYSAIGNEGVKYLSNFNKLQELNLYSTPINDVASLFDIISLTHLDLGATKVKDEDFENISRLKNLKHLNLSCCSLLTKKVLESIFTLETLESINLEGLKIHPQDILAHVVSNKESLKNLQVIFFGEGQLLGIWKNYGAEFKEAGIKIKSYKRDDVV